MMALEDAINEYLRLKEIMRIEAKEILEWYEDGSRAEFHYQTINLSDFTILLYRIIWTSGFKSKTVFDIENKYLEVLNETLMPDGQFVSEDIEKFLNQVAPVLGGHDKNRKNMAIAQILSIVNDMGWESFKREYLSPPYQRAKDNLLQLPMIGPTNVKLFLNQTGLCDIAKDDVWVTRFCDKHGFDDVDDFINQMHHSLHDERTLIDAVIFWAGSNGHIQGR